MIEADENKQNLYDSIYPDCIYSSNASEQLFDSRGRSSPVSVPQPRTLTKVEGAEQSFLSLSDNNQTSDINPHSSPLLLFTGCFASTWHWCCCRGVLRGGTEGKRLICKDEQRERQGSREGVIQGVRGRVRGEVNNNWNTALFCYSD